MAGETPLTAVGNLTAEPELRWARNGLAVVSFTVASTPRLFDRQSNEWRDGDTLFLRCSAWREHAENIAADLAKGQRVIVSGNLVQKSYEDRGGNRRTSMELQVSDIGPAIRHAAAQNGGQGSRNPAPGGRATSGPAPGAQGDAWSADAFSDDTPF